MKPWYALALLALLGTPALAGEDDKKKNPDGVERVTGSKPPPVKLEEVYATPIPSPPGVTEGENAISDIADLKTREFDLVDYRGAEELGMKPAFVHAIRAGLKKLYLRDYKGARAHFKGMQEDWPKTALIPVNEVLVWQAQMLENFDFRYQAQYWQASQLARAELKEALDDPGNEAWEHFLMAGMAGIESIHTMRQSQYLKALQLAFEAVDEVNATREAAPDFTDLMLADGMYNYWRTVVTMNSKLLPDFGDHRVEGIRQMLAVEDSGIFLSAPATLALVFTWIEEGSLKNALGKGLRNKKAYPDNVINNLITGSTYVYMRKYDLAQGCFEDVLRVDPENRRVHYWKGLAFQRSKQYDEAKASFETYLAFDYLEDYHRSHATYRLGQVMYRKKEYKEAEKLYKAAVKLDGHKSAKRALDRMKQRKKEGKIDY